MTNRMDHTNHDHSATPAARKVCRDAYYGQIQKAQHVYLDVMADPDFAGQSDYEAMVDLFAMCWGMDLYDAYQVIEKGPVITK